MFIVLSIVLHKPIFNTCIWCSWSISSTALLPPFPLFSLSTWCGMGEKGTSAPGSIFLDSPYPSHKWKVPKTPFSELYLSLWLLKKTSVVLMWDGKSGLRWHQPCGALGLEHTQLWVTDACSPLLMWPACETMAPAILHKGPRLL